MVVEVRVTVILGKGSIKNRAGIILHIDWV